MIEIRQNHLFFLTFGEFYDIIIIILTILTKELRLAFMVKRCGETSLIDINSIFYII